MLTALRQRLSFLQVIGILSVVALTAPSIWIAFIESYPNRWALTGVLLAFFTLFLLDDEICSLHPRAAYGYMAVQTVLVLSALLLLPGFGWFIILYYVLSAEAMLLFSRREGAVWVLIFVLVSAAYLLFTAEWQDALLSLLVYLAGFLFFAAFSYQTAEAVRARRESEHLLAELQAAHDQLQAYAAQAEYLAISKERNRLAREVHDTLGHRLTVAAVQLEGAQRLIPADPQRAAQMVGTVRQQVREALAELRATVATLRAPLEADLSLPKALQRLAQSFEAATGITMHLMLPEQMPPLPDAHRLALFRSAQEALTNVQKHAHASDAWLQVTRQDGRITLTVTDNGVGIPGPVGESGFGLRGLRERAIRLQGELVVEPRAGGGTQVSISLPIPPGEDRG